MFEDLREQWQIVRQGLAPLRLTRWQLLKLFAAQIYRDNPILATLLLVSGSAAMLWLIYRLSRPKKLEQVVNLPVLGGSKTLKSDFVQVVEQGKQKVSDKRKGTR